MRHECYFSSVVAYIVTIFSVKLHKVRIANEDEKLREVHPVPCRAEVFNKAGQPDLDQLDAEEQRLRDETNIAQHRHVWAVNWYEQSGYEWCHVSDHVHGKVNAESSLRCYEQVVNELLYGLFLEEFEVVLVDVCDQSSKHQVIHTHVARELLNINESVEAIKTATLLEHAYLLADDQLLEVDDVVLDLNVHALVAEVVLISLNDLISHLTVHIVEVVEFVLGQEGDTLV